MEKMKTLSLEQQSYYCDNVDNFLSFVHDQLYDKGIMCIRLLPSDLGGQNNIGKSFAKGGLMGLAGLDPLLSGPDDEDSKIPSDLSYLDIDKIVNIVPERYKHGIFKKKYEKRNYYLPLSNVVHNAMNAYAARVAGSRIAYLKMLEIFNQKLNSNNKKTDYQLICESLRNASLLNDNDYEMFINAPQHVINGVDFNMTRFLKDLYKNSENIDVAVKTNAIEK